MQTTREDSPSTNLIYQNLIASTPELYSPSPGGSAKVIMTDEAQQDEKSPTAAPPSWYPIGRRDSAPLSRCDFAWQSRPQPPGTTGGGAWYDNADVDGGHWPKIREFRSTCTSYISDAEPRQRPPRSPPVGVPTMPSSVPGASTYKPDSWLTSAVPGPASRYNYEAPGPSGSGQGGWPVVEPAAAEERRRRFLETFWQPEKKTEAQRMRFYNVQMRFWELLERGGRRGDVLGQLEGPSADELSLLSKEVREMLEQGNPSAVDMSEFLHTMVDQLRSQCTGVRREISRLQQRLDILSVVCDGLDLGGVGKEGKSSSEQEDGREEESDTMAEDDEEEIAIMDELLRTMPH